MGTVGYFRCGTIFPIHLARSLKYRSRETEWLDQPDIPKEELVKNLRELRTINRLLGGHKATFKGLDKLIPPERQEVTVIDIGCGGGDTLEALQDYARKKGLTIRSTGVDILKDAVEYARSRFSGEEPVSFIQGDIKEISGSYDIATCSLFCHHLYDSNLTGSIQKMYDLSELGVVINDLHRHPLAYHGIGILSKLLSGSAYLKNDAPLSVRKGFKRDEWIELLSELGIQEFQVDWVWAFRHCITIPKEASHG